jgi:hypothetical protein
MVNLGPTELYQPRLGDIGITKITGAGGLAIRFGQWLNGDGFADREHAYVVVAAEPGTDDVGTIVEAMPGGAQKVRNWHTDNRWLICPDQYREAVAAVALRCVGVPYSWADYGAIALHRFHIPTPHLKDYIRTSRSMICSQLADYAANKGGWHLFQDGRWEGDVTPGDLYRLWRSLPEGEKA